MSDTDGAVEGIKMSGEQLLKGVAAPTGVVGVLGVLVYEFSKTPDVLCTTAADRRGVAFPNCPDYVEIAGIKFTTAAQLAVAMAAVVFAISLLVLFLSACSDYRDRKRAASE